MDRLKLLIKRAFWCATFIFFLIAAPIPASACPNCKNAQIDSKDADASRRMSNGYLASYAIMSGMPFLLIAGLAGLLWNSRRGTKD